MKVEVRCLAASDDRSKFDSGDVDLDRFFRKYAGQNQFRHHIGVTYVAAMEEQLVGFFTVSPSQIDIEGLPKSKMKKLPKYPLPVLRLARLAVDKRYQGYGLGKLMLKKALRLALTLRDEFGCVGVVVDAKADAIEFYEQLGFEALGLESGYLGERPHPVPMFIPISAIPD